MKASYVMFFYYAGMIGVPVLLVLLALFALVPVAGVVTEVLFILIGAGSIVYGSIAVREAYIHGGKRK